MCYRGVGPVIPPSLSSSPHHHRQRKILSRKCLRSASLDPGELRESSVLETPKNGPKAGFFCCCWFGLGGVVAERRSENSSKEGVNFKRRRGARSTGILGPFLQKEAPRLGWSGSGTQTPSWSAKLESRHRAGRCGQEKEARGGAPLPPTQAGDGLRATGVAGRGEGGAGRTLGAESRVGAARGRGSAHAQLAGCPRRQAREAPEAPRSAPWCGRGTPTRGSRGGGPRARRQGARFGAGPWRYCGWRQPRPAPPGASGPCPTSECARRAGGAGARTAGAGGEGSLGPRGAPGAVGDGVQPVRVAAACRSPPGAFLRLL